MTPQLRLHHRADRLQLLQPQPAACGAQRGGIAYCYDANGNMTSRDGSGISWTSYNKPAVINDGGGDSASFSYGPSRARYKQVNVEGATTETTYYIGGRKMPPTWKFSKTSLLACLSKSDQAIDTGLRLRLRAMRRRLPSCSDNLRPLRPRTGNSWREE